MDRFLNVKHFFERVCKKYVLKASSRPLFNLGKCPTQNIQCMKQILRKQDILKEDYQNL